MAFPTETVYGLGANALLGEAVAAIYAAKGRPSFNPLIIHFAGGESAAKQVQWNERAETLARAFWPGPLTLVLPRRPDSGVSLLAGAGLETLAVRVPDHPLALEFLRLAAVPVAAPSANRSGRISPTTAAHVREELGDSAQVLEGGACRVGLESTVLDLSGDVPLILRPGAVTAEMLSAALGENIRQVGEGAAISAPGMMLSHYAPTRPMRLNAKEIIPGEALLAFGPNVPQGARRRLNLSETGNLAEAAANLFAYMRALDAPEHMAIAVMPIPDDDLGAAINDRLRRAAAKA